MCAATHDIAYDVSPLGHYNLCIREDSSNLFSFITSATSFLSLTISMWFLLFGMVSLVIP
jgi:hypothetical protein